MENLFPTKSDTNQHYRIQILNKEITINEKKQKNRRFEAKNVIQLISQLSLLSAHIIWPLVSLRSDTSQFDQASLTFSIILDLYPLPCLQR